MRALSGDSNPAATNQQKRKDELTDTNVEFDPFADEEAPAVKKAAPKKAATAAPKPEADTRVGGTVKGGAGFDVPWLTPSWPTWKAAAEDLADPETQEHMKFVADQLARFSAYFQGKVAEYAPAKPAAAAPSNRAPAGATEPPAGTPAAPGPDWTYKTGVGKTGKPWKAWMPPRGSNENPVWL